MTTFTTTSGYLKEVYAPAIERQLATELVYLRAAGFSRHYSFLNRKPLTRKEVRQRKHRKLLVDIVNRAINLFKIESHELDAYHERDEW